MAVDITNFPTNLNYNSFRNSYLNAAKTQNQPVSQAEMDSLWGIYSSPQPTTSNSNTNGGKNIVQKAVGGLVGITSDIIGTQESNPYGIQTSQMKSSDLLSQFVDANNNLKSMKDIIGVITSGGLNLMKESLQEQTDLFHQMNVGAGLTGELSKDIREELTKASPELLKIGIGFDQLANAAEELVNNTSRFVSLNRDSWLQAGRAATAYVGTLSDMTAMFPSFEKVGYGAGDVAEIIETSGKRTIDLGLQSKGVLKDVGANLSKVNEYGFKNGIQGLAEMARKSKEFRMEMSQVFQIADQVMDPDKAIAMTAELQAIGGALGDFNDPLKLMYMATNDAEGLQDAMIGVAGSLATYNQEQGRFEITGANLRKAKELAKSMGMDYNQLANSAIAAAERSSAATAMLSSGLNLDDDQKRFLTNISQMKGGQMTIELNSDRIKEALGVGTDTKEIALENLTQAQAETLLKYQDELKTKTPEDIIKGQATAIEQMNRDVNFIAQLLRSEFASSAKLANQRLGLENKITEFSGKVASEARTKIPDAANTFIETATKLSDAVIKGVSTVKPTTVDNSTQPNQTNTKTETNTTPQKSEVTVTVKTDEPMMDEFTRYVYRRPDLISGMTNETPGSYTQNK